jgi:hypothetical protein
MAFQLARDEHWRRPDLLLQQVAEQDPAPASIEDFGHPSAWDDPALLARQRRRQSGMPFPQAVLSARKHARSSVALTRPKLGFELGTGEEKGQIGEARSVGEGRKFAG